MSEPQTGIVFRISNLDSDAGKQIVVTESALREVTVEVLPRP